MMRAILRGAAAGAAGTTALNAVTYLDMAVRGRPTSSTPEQSVEKIAHLAGAEVPGRGDTRQNRLQGLGALTGLATGVVAGAVWGAAAEAARRPTAAISGLLVGAGALVAANGPMALLGVSDPRSWSPADWLSDVVPHLAYGLVTAFTYDAMAS
jgi:hypothetical protein